MTYSSPAILLGYRDWREYDRLYILYTKEFGKEEAVATGTRRIKSKLAPHLTPFTLVDCMFAKGRYVERLIQASALISFPRLHQDLECLAKASFCSELLDRLTKPGVKDERIYHLLLNGLAAIEQGKVFDTSGFTVSLFDMLGFAFDRHEVTGDCEDLAKKYFLMHPETRPRSSAFLELVRN